VSKSNKRRSRAERRNATRDARSAASGAPPIKPPWHEHWRGFIRAGETAAVIACIVGAVSVSGDMAIAVPLLIVAAVMSAISIAAEPSLSKVLKAAAIAITLLLIGGIGEFIYYHHKTADDIATSTNYITDWGAGSSPGVPTVEKFTPGNVSSYKGEAKSHLVVNGDLVRKTIGGQYRLVGVIYHHANTGDMQDEPDISKSGPYDVIAGPIHILIPWNDTFLRERVSGYVGTAYELLAIPIDKVNQKFTTVRQAVALGGKRLDGRRGPP
jgi:hypothetical protein